MAITAKELAKKLNISEAAVSIALNNKPGVSTAKKKEIIKAAQHYGYDFSRINSRLTLSSKQSITFIFYHKCDRIVTNTHFFSNIARGIEEICQTNSYSFHAYHIYDEDFEDNLKTLLDDTCKGLIILGTELTEDDLARFKNIKVPIILLDTYFETVSLDCISINNVQGAMEATEYLIKKYKKQPGYLRSAFTIRNFTERMDGYKKGLHKNGFSSSNTIIHNVSPSFDEAYADMKQILDDGIPLARCYFADNDLIAYGCMKALIERGYRVPEDVAIIGFDNILSPDPKLPKLSTINVPCPYIGQTAAHRLLYSIESHPASPLRIEVATNLVIRISA